MLSISSTATISEKDDFLPRPESCHCEVDDLKNNDALLEEVENLDPGIEVTVAWANEHGYSFSLEELVAHIEAEKARLSDEDLDAVAGGVGGTGQTPHHGGYIPYGIAVATGGLAHLPGIDPKP